MILRSSFWMIVKMAPISIFGRYSPVENLCASANYLTIHLPPATSEMSTWSSLLQEAAIRFGRTTLAHNNVPTHRFLIYLVAAYLNSTESETLQFAVTTILSLSLLSTAGGLDGCKTKKPCLKRSKRESRTLRYRWSTLQPFHSRNSSVLYEGRTYLLESMARG